MPIEKIAEFTDLLSDISDEDLASLSRTITGLDSQQTNREGSLRNIANYSANEEELLHRKRIRRDFLFSYLVRHQIIVPVRSTKHALIDAILNSWGLKQNTIFTERPSTTPSPPQPVVSRQNAFADQFVRWFYAILNAERNRQIPDATGTEDTFSVLHFFNDCKIKMQYATPDIQEEAYEGSQLVFERLKALVCEELLQFAPNTDLDDGVRVFTTRHGLVMVTCCGSIHRDANCLGIFEQVFGLAQEPSSAKWKIKLTNLKIATAAAAHKLAIGDSQ